jgi:hypothetical protein
MTESQGTHREEHYKGFIYSWIEPPLKGVGFQMNIGSETVGLHDLLDPSETEAKFSKPRRGEGGRSESDRYRACTAPIASLIEEQRKMTAILINQNVDVHYECQQFGEGDNSKRAAGQSCASYSGRPASRAPFVHSVSQSDRTIGLQNRKTK